MNIHGKIVTAMVAFEHLTGKPPGLVYAGEDEIAELEAMARALKCSIPVAGGVRNSIAGLEIIEVKDKSFLSVGIKT